MSSAEHRAETAEQIRALGERAAELVEHRESFAAYEALHKAVTLVWAQASEDLSAQLLAAGRKP